MPVYTVVAAKQLKAVDGKFGPSAVNKLRLTDEHGGTKDVEWFAKASTPLPSPGDQIEGDITQGDYGLKFKKAAKAFNAGGPRQEDPKRSAAIQRMHSQSAAVALVHAKAVAGLATPADFTPGKLSDLADWFDVDANKARDRA